MIREANELLQSDKIADTQRAEILIKHIAKMAPIGKRAWSIKWQLQRLGLTDDLSKRQQKRKHRLEVELISLLGQFHEDIG